MKKIVFLFVAVFLTCTVARADTFYRYPAADVSTGAWQESPASGFFYTKIDTLPDSSSDPDYVWCSASGSTAAFQAGKVVPGWVRGTVTVTLRWRLSRLAIPPGASPVLTLGVLNSAGASVGSLTVTSFSTTSFSNSTLTLGSVPYSTAGQITVTLTAASLAAGDQFQVSSVEVQYSLNSWQTFEF
jgi:hypothetical protein